MENIEFITKEEKEKMSINDLESYLELLALVKAELTKALER